MSSTTSRSGAPKGYSATQALDYARIVVREADALRFDAPKTEMLAREVVRLNGMLDDRSAASEKQAPITDNDRRWRFLEHGCQWVSFTPIGGDTRSFDPRIVSGYAGHLQDMRETVDREAEKHLAILREGINAAKR